MGTGGTPSADGPDGQAAVPERKQQKKGRFIVKEEENIGSRAPSKVPSQANLLATGGRSIGSAAAVLPELLRLHEQSVSHANSLARVIDSVRASCSGGNLSGAEELGAPLAGAAGALPPRKPAAGSAAAVAGSGSGLLSRVNSSRLLLGGQDLKVVSLQQLLQESNGDSMDVAEKLYERVQVGAVMAGWLAAPLQLAHAADLWYQQQQSCSSRPAAVVDGSGCCCSSTSSLRG
jgi:hypothetical protein